MIVNVKNIKAIFINLKTTFQKAFDQTPSDWQKVAMKVPSTSKQNDYSWLGRFPKMRKWIGDKAVKALEAFNYSIVNDDFEATVEVDRNDIEDDQILGLAQQAQAAGQSAAELPSDIVFALLSQGFTNLCYDGQPFFDIDHPVNGVSVSNKGTKKLSAATQAAAKASYGVARAAMRSFKDEEGASLKVRPTILVVPPALEDEANFLMTADRFPDNTPNIYKGTAEVLVVPELTSDTQWFLLDTTRPVKPLIYQERKKPEFVEQTDYNADNVFMRKKFLFGAEARAAGGYGFWQMAYGSTGEAA
ncbi:MULTISPECIES: Mu-like prophage major head subunit gpT family protein [Serratia]|uniref:Mu-like prophage major head subunit gpT family protein n=1 Tax=Serratia TaxID=613 RepID=UPI0027E502E9|nr:Mu-like prophage major head subunit gpT family protein [Serratia marcescens]MCH4195224.1 Mu-like prophage major head subunit gpT family protein [Serratia liquefaciens]MCH4231468.1 Mu-like prophage major head subunit gpT family protein [Serratia liquefaciens]MCH4263127.1 Mu-like prophage major head subunit gpT family protein [Serratia liquefaciens]MCI1213162.1 Mu-like prophage major head subunit gpT family protein [Serratia liquefaciens]MCI1234519.1 Mu-like prophage major head subunit gpT fa